MGPLIIKVGLTNSEALTLPLTLTKKQQNFFMFKMLKIKECFLTFKQFYQKYTKTSWKGHLTTYCGAPRWSPCPGSTIPPRALASWWRHTPPPLSRRGGTPAATECPGTSASLKKEQTRKEMRLLTLDEWSARESRFSHQRGKTGERKPDR